MRKGEGGREEGEEGRKGVGGEGREGRGRRAEEGANLYLWSAVTHLKLFDTLGH